MTASSSGQQPASGAREETRLLVVGSTNPAKVRPVREVVAALNPALVVEGRAVPSGVSDQPLGDDETRAGAVARARGALATPGASWGVGLEGGVRLDGTGQGWLFGYVAVASAGHLEVTRTAELRLPPRVLRRVGQREELGRVMDDLLGTVDIKRGVGTVGILTGGVSSRAAVWHMGLALALAPFLNSDLYDLLPLPPLQSGGQNG